MDINTVLAILTAVIAFFTYMVWRTYRRIEWLTGAMESHSILALRLEAARNVGANGQPIKVTWWDPDIERLPEPVHRAEATLNEIYVYLPPRLRRNRKKLLHKIWRCIAG